ncbi:MAG: PaaI family thioesterase [Acidimicrobiales bacterium]|nr:PaaI family thioesterase [Acidimicrobiales bacterium]
MPKAPGVQVPPACDLTLGMVCIKKDIPGETVWTMTVDERFCNPVGVMQGGFLAAFVDSAMGASSITAAEGRKIFSANAELKISFFRPVPMNALITCTATAVSSGSRVNFVEADVHGEDGKLLARATSTYMIRDRT